MQISQFEIKRRSFRATAELARENAERLERQAAGALTEGNTHAANSLAREANAERQKMTKYLNLARTGVR